MQPLTHLQPSRISSPHGGHDHEPSVSLVLRADAGNSGKQIDTVDLLAVLVETKVDEENPSVLAGGHDPPVVALGGQHPGSRPLGEHGGALARLEVVDAQIQVVRAADDAVVLAVQEQAAHELSVAGKGADFGARGDVEFVCDVVVAAG